MSAKRAAASAALVILLVLAGGNSSTSTSEAATASATVAAFFAAAGAQHWGQAEALLEPHARSSMRGAVSLGHMLHETFSNFKVVKVVPAPSSDGPFPGYVKLQQVTISVDVIYAKAMSKSDGLKQSTFVVGRDEASRSWQIFAPDLVSN